MTSDITPQSWLVNLEFHDDSFSKDAVVVNIDHIPGCDLPIGSLARIAPYHQAKPSATNLATSVQRALPDLQPGSDTRSHHGHTVISDGAESEISKRTGATGASKGKPARRGSHVVPPRLASDTLGTMDHSRSLVFRVTEPTPEQLTKRSGVQISLHTSVRAAFHLSNRQSAVIYAAAAGDSKADFVELAFRDQYLSRSDMWQLVVSELSNRSIYRGQQLLFMGSIKARIKNIFVKGRKVNSALASHGTVPIFRSESAKYVFFIQMSREMWEYDAEGSGEIMFNKVINGFLPDLFKRWQKASVKHLVNIILFARVEYDKGILKHVEQPGDSIGAGAESNGSKDYRDYYRAVITDMASGDWVRILSDLKREFKVFLRDTLIMPGSEAYGKLPDSLAEVKDAPDVDKVIAGRPTVAAKGNILECINLASSQFAQDYMDRDLTRTGINLVIVTAGTGVFEVDYRLLKLTTDTLVGNGIGIDLVALAPMPLHSVPLFRYQDPDSVSPEFASVAYGSFERSGSAPRNVMAHQMPTASPEKARNAYWGQKTDESAQGTEKVDELQPLWSYAMPHWIDVSFWTGEVSDSSWEQRSIVRTRRNERSDGEFRSVCRMYELQMMGLMEVEMSDICIAPISNTIATSATAAALTTSQQTSSSTNGLQTTRSQSPEKRAVEEDPAVIKQRLMLNEWMNAYEHHAFVEKPNISTRRSIAAPVALKMQPKKADTKDIDPHKTIGQSANISLISRSPRNAYAPSDHIKERQNSIASMSDVSSIRSVIPASQPAGDKQAIGQKRPKALRQISLGLMGLGPGKAVASTSLSSAGAEFSSTSAAAPASPTQATRHSGLLAQQLRNTLTRKPSQLAFSDTASQKSSILVTKPVQSNPIAIRRESSTDSASDEEGLAQTVKPGDGLLKANEYGSTVRPQSSHMNNADDDFSRKNGFSLGKDGPTAAVRSPWLTMLNPSNPRKDNMSLANQFRRWQHVFPKAVSTSAIKWKSLTSPAALPLTSEHFPSLAELEEEFEESSYTVRVPASDDAGIRPQGVNALMRLLIAARLSSGFQIVIGHEAQAYAKLKGCKLLDCFHPDLDVTKDKIVLMSVGNGYHQLQMQDQDEVTVHRYHNKELGRLDDQPDVAIDYRPYIRTMMAETYEKRRFILRNPRSKYDWNLIDAHCAGGQGELLQELRYWRARFVLIPVDVPRGGRGPLAPVSEVSDEETRLEGIQKLTQMWQRYRYLPTAEKRYHTSFQQRNKDHNPLAIDYQTRDPSAVVKNYAAGTMDPLMLGLKENTLFTEAEHFHSNDFDMQKVAQHFQSKPPRGITVADRRWHWKVYESCFRGDEFTTWLLANFKDIESREDAVKLGNELMKRGLFKHVQSKHHFRDGNYFYSVLEEYRTTATVDSKSGWFGSRLIDRSVPTTPSVESQRSSPLAVRRPESRHSRDDSSAASSGNATPVRVPKNIELSKLLQYDVDPREKSWRPEIIHLHYDRIHNPENCYHIRIDWMNVTSKLIEDVIVSWASSVERYGLKLVEIPIGESSQIGSQHPFRAPYRIPLAYQPPRTARRASLDPTATGVPLADEHFPHHRALLKKWDFVLDTEAARSFDCTVSVTYSWGKPDYKYTQFIHKSGTLIVEIDDNGDFLIVANRQYTNRSNAAVQAPRHEQPDWHTADRRLQRATPYSSPSLRPVEPPSPHMLATGSVPKPGHLSRHPSRMPFLGARSTQSLCEQRLAGAPQTAENVLAAFELFCRSRAELEAFFEASRLGPSTAPSPRNSPRFFPASVSARLEDIPSLGLGERRIGIH